MSDKISFLQNVTRITLGVFLSPLIWYIQSARDENERKIRFSLSSELMSIWPFQLGIIVREVFYQRTLKNCGKYPVVRFGTVFLYPETELGERVFIGNNCVIGLATIKDNTMLANNISILSGRYHHRRDDPQGELLGGELKRITIGESVWIGAGAVVMADVSDSVIIGAGTIVVREIPEGSTVVGNPARILGG